MPTDASNIDLLIDSGALDVDFDGSSTALGDGLMVIRHLFGSTFSGDAWFRKRFHQIRLSNTWTMLINMFPKISTYSYERHSPSLFFYYKTNLQISLIIYMLDFHG